MTSTPADDPQSGALDAVGDIGNFAWGTSSKSAPQARQNATHDPLLHAHLLQSRYATGPARKFRPKWRHVVLNLNSGDLKIYSTPEDDSPTHGRKNNPNAIGSKNRVKTELYLKPRNDASGAGGKKSRKVEALVSSLPDESDLEVMLPRGLWEMKDVANSDQAFVIKYDLRAELRKQPDGSGSVPSDASQDLTLQSTASRTTKIKDALSVWKNKTPKKSVPEKQSADTPLSVKFESPPSSSGTNIGSSNLFADTIDEDTIASDIPQSQEDGNGPNNELSTLFAVSAAADGAVKFKSKSKIIFHCVGGGNEKAMWQNAATKCGGIVRFPDKVKAPASREKKSVVPESMESALNLISSSKAVSTISKNVPKSVVPSKPKSSVINWRYRKDFTAAGALNMSVYMRGNEGMANAFNSANRSSFIDDDDDDLSLDHIQDEDDQGRIKEYKVQPQWAYPNVWMTPKELMREMLRKSDNIKDLRQDLPGILSTPNMPKRIGSLQVEVLSCHGLARRETVANSINLSDGSGGAVVYLVAGNNAFCTDTIPGIKDHFWLRKTQRAVIFPIYHPYTRLYAGVFDASTNDFAGRAMVDIAALRPESVYEIMLPLRETAQLYTRRGRGVIQLRFKLEYDNEKAAVLSYLPPSLNTKPMAIPCGDKTAFKNVARTVHGNDLHGKWNRPIQKATTRELKLYKKHTKAVLKQIVEEVTGWVKPTYSLYVFVAWMHCVYRASLGLVLPYFFGFVVMCLVRNYALMILSCYKHNGYATITIKEILAALIFNKSQCFHSLEVEKQAAHVRPPHPQWPFPIYSFLGIADQPAKEEDTGNHLEFPFSDGERQQKLTLAESYAKEEMAPDPESSLHHGKNLDDEDEDEYGDNDGLDAETRKSIRNTQDPNESAREHIAPDQNMDVFVKGTTIFEDLEEFYGIAHTCTGGVVNDKVVQIRRPGKESGKMNLMSVNERKDDLFGDADDDGIKDDVEHAVASLEKALGIGVQRNPVLVMQQKFAGPVVRIQRVGLIFYRSIFNLFMWSDPFASFWLLVVLIGLVVITALIPWRLLFFLAGVVAVGPQNLIIRVYKERHPSTKTDENTPQEKQTPSKASNVSRGESSATIDLFSERKPLLGHSQIGRRNSGEYDSTKNDAKMPEVLVPYTPLRQDRFYDFPPEPTKSFCKPINRKAARVVKCVPAGGEIAKGSTPTKSSGKDRRTAWSRVKLLRKNPI